MASYTGLVHIGYALLGFSSITVIGWHGSALVLFAYGIAITAVLILFDIIIQRSGVFLVDSFGGLGTRMPVYTALLTVALLACTGVPGFAVFMGMFLCFSGMFQVNPLFPGIALGGVILTVIYLIRFLSRSVWGPLPYQWKELADINLKETLLVVPCLIVIIVFGFYPQPLLTIINQSLIQLIGIAP
jgi:NADH-quinone oxidoreductase subunit M